MLFRVNAQSRRSRRSWCGARYPVRGRRRHPLLGAQGGARRPRVPAAAGGPRRRARVPARDPRSGARDRAGRDGSPRGRRRAAGTLALPGGGAPPARRVDAAGAPGAGGVLRAPRRAAGRSRAAPRRRRSCRELLERSGLAAQYAAGDEDDRSRRANLDQLVAAAAEAAERGLDLGGVPGRGGPAHRRGCAARGRRGAALDAARRQGARVRSGVPGRDGGRPPAAAPRGQRRGRRGGGAAPRLRGDDAGRGGGCS